MRREDVKVGMKVVPHSKSYSGYYDKLEHSTEWEGARRKGQKFMYVARIDYDKIVLSKSEHSGIGDWFLPSDFTLYKDGKVEKQTLELIFNGKTTVAILKNEDGSYTKGVARLHPLDTYDKEIGIRIAIAKALGEDFDHILKSTIAKRIEDFSNEELMAEIQRRMK